jgi:hypothetical protein
VDIQEKIVPRNIRVSPDEGEAGSTSVGAALAATAQSVDANSAVRAAEFWKVMLLPPDLAIDRRDELSFSFEKDGEALFKVLRLPVLKSIAPLMSDLGAICGELPVARDPFSEKEMPSMTFGGVLSLSG